MSIQGVRVGVPCEQATGNCPDKFNCPAGTCPDFTIKRHDTKPAFKVSLKTCDGVFDLSEENLVVEVNLWTKGKLKSAIDESNDYFGLADNIGFEQILVGDIIVMDRVRRPEYMLVIGFDENNKLVRVQRGYNGTDISAWKKGTSFKIFRLMNASGEVELSVEDITQLDGTVLEDQLTEAFLVYEWSPESTCLPGCFWLEFKLLKMAEEVTSSSLSTTPSVTPSFTPSTYTPADYGCSLGDGVSWSRRLPVDKEGFLIKIVDAFFD